MSLSLKASSSDKFILQTIIRLNYIQIICAPDNFSSIPIPKSNYTTNSSNILTYIHQKKRHITNIFQIFSNLNKKKKKKKKTTLFCHFLRLIIEQTYAKRGNNIDNSWFVIPDIIDSDNRRSYSNVNFHLPG